MAALHVRERLRAQVVTSGGSRPVGDPELFAEVEALRREVQRLSSSRSGAIRLELFPKSSDVR